jgi:hypothetical protein
MLRMPLRLIRAGLMSAVLLGACALGADTDKEAAHSFMVKIESKMDMEIQGNKQKLDAYTELRYTWKRSGRERALSLESALVQVKIDGKEIMNNFMSRAKFSNTEQGKTKEVPFEDANEELKKILRDSFDVPVCKLQVDENGKEVKRTIVAGPGAKALIDNGMIANAVLFHSPFPRDQNEWQADAEVSMGQGGYVKGKLAYKKTTGAKAGQSVKVSGTLTNEGFKQQDTALTIKKVNYIVSGEQTYDPAQQEWVSGKLAMDVSFQMATDQAAVGSVKGIMVVSFAKTAGKK